MADIRKPAYTGRPEPQKVAQRFMLITVLLLVLGFVRAGIDNKWFDAIFKFINS